MLTFLNLKKPLFVFLLCVFAGCSESSGPSARPDPQWTAFKDPYWLRYQAQVGSRRYFGSLESHEVIQWSQEDIDQALSVLPSLRGELERVDTASDWAEFEKQHLLHKVRSDLFWLSTVEWYKKSPGFYFASAKGLFFADAQRNGQQPSNLGLIPRAAENIQDSLNTPMHRAFIDYSVENLTRYLSDLTVLNTGDDQKVVKQEAIQGVESLLAWFQRQYATATQDLPLSPERFVELLSQGEGSDIAMAELKSWADAELRQGLDALSKSCARQGLADVNVCLGDSDRLDHQSLQHRCFVDWIVDSATPLTDPVNHAGWSLIEDQVGWGRGDMDPMDIQCVLIAEVSLLVAIGLYWDQVSFAEAQQMFENLAHLGDTSARIQTMRVAVDPTLLRPALGKILIKRLFTTWQGKTNGDWRSFVERFSSYGKAPVPVIHKAMLAGL